MTDNWEAIRAEDLRPGDLTATGRIEVVDHHGDRDTVELLIDGCPRTQNPRDLIRRRTPTTCGNRLAGGPLVCTRDHTTQGPGCVYESATGSHVDDRHADGGHG